MLRHVRILAVGGALAVALLAGAGHAQQAGSPGTVPDGSIAPAVAAAPEAALLPAKIAHVIDSGYVYRVDVANKQMVGTRVRIDRTLTDIAFTPNGNFYGINFTTFYSIVLRNGVYRTTARGAGLGQGNSGMNALVCPTNTSCLGFSYRSQLLYRIDVATGRATNITPIRRPTGFTSAGDLIFHEGRLYLSSQNRNLVPLSAATGLVLNPPGAKAHGIADLWGLVSTGTNKLYGFARTTLYEIDEDTGRLESTTPLPPQPRGPAQIRGAAFK